MLRKTEYWNSDTEHNGQMQMSDKSFFSEVAEFTTTDYCSGKCLLGTLPSHITLTWVNMVGILLS